MDRHVQLVVCAFGVLFASACNSPSSPGDYQKPAADTVTKAAEPAGPAGIATAQTPLGTILTDSRNRRRRGEFGADWYLLTPAGTKIDND